MSGTDFSFRLGSRMIICLLTLSVFTTGCTEGLPQPDVSVVQNSQRVTPEHSCIFIVENKPEFPGGHRTWKTYMRENLQKPILCMEGKVYLSCVVSATGKISDVEVIRGLHPIADQFAIELLKKSPKWRPATQQSVPVKTSMMIKISFSTNS